MCDDALAASIPTKPGVPRVGLIDRSMDLTGAQAGHCWWRQKQRPVRGADATHKPAGQPDAASVGDRSSACSACKRFSPAPAPRGAPQRCSQSMTDPLRACWLRRRAQPPDTSASTPGWLPWRLGCFWRVGGASTPCWPPPGAADLLAPASGGMRQSSAADHVIDGADQVRLNDPAPSAPAGRWRRPWKHCTVVTATLNSSSPALRRPAAHSTAQPAPAQAGHAG